MSRQALERVGMGGTPFSEGEEGATLNVTPHCSNGSSGNGLGGGVKRGGYACIFCCERLME